MKTIRVEIDVADDTTLEQMSRIATCMTLGATNSYGHQEGRLLARRAFWSRGLTFRRLKFWPLRGMEKKFLAERKERELTQVA